MYMPRTMVQDGWARNCSSPSMQFLSPRDDERGCDNVGFSLGLPSTPYAVGEEGIHIKSPDVLRFKFLAKIEDDDHDVLMQNLYIMDSTKDWKGCMHDFCACQICSKAMARSIDSSEQVPFEDCVSWLQDYTRRRRNSHWCFLGSSCHSIPAVTKSFLPSCSAEAPFCVCGPLHRSNDADTFSEIYRASQIIASPRQRPTQLARNGSDE